MIHVQQNVPLADLAWWKVGGAADFLVRPQNIHEVEEALLWAATRNLPVTVLGGASNVLISDDGIEGLVLLTRDLTGVEKVDENWQVNPTASQTDRLRLIALAGTNKAELTKFFLQHKLPPALFLCGLPGDVGGGVVMNAGVGEMIVPREFVEIVDWIEVVRLKNQEKSSTPQVERVRYDKSQIQWEYRHSSGWQPGVIVRVGVSWENQPQAEVMNLVRQATKKRLQSQPLEWPSCGSTFRNPKGGKAGALIEQAGLKGFSLGAAEVSQKHANFIINRGGAKAADVMGVLQHVQNTVRERHGVELVPEVKFLGRWKLLATPAKPR